MLKCTLTKLVPTRVLAQGGPLDLSEEPYTSDVQVVGECDYQEHLSSLAEYGVQPCFGVATLVPVNHEPLERNAVRVDIAPIDLEPAHRTIDLGSAASDRPALPVRYRPGTCSTFTVGYLSYEDAMKYRMIFDERAIIVQASIQADELGEHYGVWLEVPYWAMREQAA